ncbi:MAG: hypothetical protein WDN44_14460 [Sphingomonas sp.]
MPAIVAVPAAAALQVTLVCWRTIWATMSSIGRSTVRRSCGASTARITPAEVLTPFVQVQGHPIDLLIGMAIELPFTLAGAVLALLLTGGELPAGDDDRARDRRGDRPAQGRARAQSISRSRSAGGAGWCSRR